MGTFVIWIKYCPLFNDAIMYGKEMLPIDYRLTLNLRFTQIIFRQFYILVISIVNHINNDDTTKVKSCFTKVARQTLTINQMSAITTLQKTLCKNLSFPSLFFHPAQMKMLARQRYFWLQNNLRSYNTWINKLQSVP